MEVLCYDPIAESWTTGRSEPRQADVEEGRGTIWRANRLTNVGGRLMSRLNRKSAR